MLPRPRSVQIALDVLLWSLWSCTEEVLVGNSGGRESAASQRAEHTGSPFPWMLRGKSSCDVPASAIGRLKVTGPECAVKPRADLQFLVGEWPSQQRSLYRTCHDCNSWFRFSPCGAHRLQTMTLVPSTNAAIEKFAAKAESAASEKGAKDFSKSEAEQATARESYHGRFRLQRDRDWRRHEQRRHSRRACPRLLLMNLPRCPPRSL